MHKHEETTCTHSYDDTRETYAREMPEMLELKHEDVAHMNLVGEAYTELPPMPVDPYTAPDTVFSFTHGPSLHVSPLCEDVCLVAVL